MDIGQVAFTRDPTAPKKLPESEAKQGLRHDQQLQQLLSQRELIKAELVFQHSTLKNATSRGPQESEEYEDIQHRIKERKNFLTREGTGSSGKNISLLVEPS